MKTRFTLLAVALTACSSTAPLNGPATLDRSSPATGASIDISAEGGFAALLVRHAISHDDRRYVYTRRQLCGTSCGAPLDSASGTLTAGAVDSVFTAVLTQNPFALKDDYGTTKGGADMFAYTVHIVSGGKTKTIRFDDGTMPEPMRQILVAVQATVSAARR